MYVRKMCSIATNAVLVAGLTLGGAALYAQDTPPPPDTATQGSGSSGYHHHHHHHRMDPDRALARMTKRYSLSQDQQNQIKPILESQTQQMQALHADTSLSREDRWTKMQAIHSDSNTKIEAVLNDSQKAKFEQDQEHRQQRMHEKMQKKQGQGSGEQAPPPPPPQ
jgi:hypothetical protein